MFSVLGAAALSQFRLDRLQRTLREQEPRVRGLSARHIHFVEASRELDESELGILDKLLTYGAPDCIAHTDVGDKLLVTPRSGTVSPWSSKATDIAHVCGLTAITRLERGTLYFVDATQSLSPHELARAAVWLHDRMD